MMKDNPLNIQEEEMISVISKYSNNNPYVKIGYDKLTHDEQKVFSKDKIETLIQKYMSNQYPDYPRLRWFFRRLSQIGVGEAVDYCVRNMEQLIPAISDVCQYLIAATSAYTGEWLELGDMTFCLLNNELFKANEFFQITLLNLYVCNTKMNHMDKLVTLYSHSSENIKRKIILSAYKNNSVSFIRELKEQYPTMQEWNKRSFIVACSNLPIEERKHFLKYIKTFLNTNDYLERILIEWSLKQ